MNDCSLWVGLGVTNGQEQRSYTTCIVEFDTCQVGGDSPRTILVVASRSSASGQRVLCFSFTREACSRLISEFSEAEYEKKRLPRDGEGGGVGCEAK